MATKPLDATLPFKTVSVDLEANTAVTREALSAPHEILGISADWPGPDEPFER